MFLCVFKCRVFVVVKTKASVEEEVNVPRSEIEKNAFKVFKLKQFVSCLILTLFSPEKDR